MSVDRKGLTILVACLVLAAVVVALAVGCGSKSSASSTSSPAASASIASTGTLQVWGGGDFAMASPGSGIRTYFNEIVAAFKVAHPGWNVQLTQLSSNMDQLIAKIQAAATAHALPDLVEFFSGSFLYAFKSQLTPLNSYINATPGFKDSLSGWDLCSLDLNPNGTSVGVPQNSFSYMLYYNKAMFAKAGITKPPTTYAELYTDGLKLKATGVVPIAYGDRDGYTTANWLVVNLGSYLGPGDIERLAKGQIKFTDPRIVAALTAIVKLHQLGIVSPDATTHEQNDAIGAFIAGKAAMCEIFPTFIPQFEKSLGKNLGIAPLPQSGTGPLAGKGVGQTNDTWWIPKGAANTQAAWDFIRIASNYELGLAEQKYLAYPSSNIQASSNMTDPFARAVADFSRNAPTPNADTVVNLQTSLTWYKHLQLAFAGIETPEKALAATEQANEAALAAGP